MDVLSMFQAELIDVNVGAATQEELFFSVGRKLEKKGYVYPKYTEALRIREAEFPTGLITPFLNIALPHTDPDFIERPFIFFVRTIWPIEIKQMGDNQQMEVKNFFFLGIKEPTAQVGILQKLMEMFQNQSFVYQLRECVNKEEIWELFKNYV